MTRSPADRIIIEGLRVKSRIGVYPWEQKILQRLVLDIVISGSPHRARPPRRASPPRWAGQSDRLSDTADYEAISRFLIQFSKTHRHQLIEAFAENAAAALLKTFHLKQVGIRVAKPGAVKAARTVAVEIVRTAGSG